MLLQFNWSAVISILRFVQVSIISLGFQHTVSGNHPEPIYVTLQREHKKCLSNPWEGIIIIIINVLLLIVVLIYY